MLRTSERYYRFSQRLAARAVTAARRAPTLAAAAVVVAQHQATQVTQAQAANTAMLAEQGIDAPSRSLLVPYAFTTPIPVTEAMLTQADVDWQFQRLVNALVQDIGRAAQAVDIATRPHVQHVRHLNLPSCSRCAVLAGRVYRYSTGFQRHPGCDCVMVPVTVASPDLTYDPAQLARDGLVTGLSKADLEALDAGADFNQIVNVRAKKAGLTEAGQVLDRAGRPTPAGIFRSAANRDEALSLLQQHGYIR